MKSRSRLLRDAACAQADPRFFDVITWDMAEPALSYCRECPVVPICERHVLSSRPTASHFDGVAGGRLWRDGRPVPKPAQWKKPIWRPNCGNRIGRELHELEEELYCTPCTDSIPPEPVQLMLGD